MEKGLALYSRKALSENQCPVFRRCNIYVTWIIWNWYFSIPPQQLDGIDIQTSFESFYRQLSSNLQCSQFSRLKQRLKGLCFSYIYGYKAYQLNNLSTEELQCFKRLSKRQDIVFC